MDSEHRKEFHRIEVDAEKTSLVFVVAVLFLGAAISASISLEGGTIVQAILSAQEFSSKWSGFSGDSIGYRNDTPESFNSMAVTNETSTTNELNFRLQVDQRHYIAAIPSAGGDFDPDRLGNLSLSDIDGGNIFDRYDYPVFYPEDSSYDEIRDAPNDTYKDTSEITLFEEPYHALKTTLEDDVTTYLLSYTVNGEEEPIFLTSIKQYDSCYNGESCNYQLMLPELNGSKYHIYMPAEIRPVNLTTFIDGNRSRTFPHAGRPYNLTVTTRAIFEDNRLINRTIRVSEKEGNNLLVPAVSSSNYSSEAEIITETQNGVKSILFAPTKYSSPENYNLTVEIMTSGGEVGQEEKLYVGGERIETTNNGPTEKGFPNRENEYKKGVNHMRPIANCLFVKLSNENARELGINSSDSGFTLVRGVPYIVDLENSDAAYYRLEEPSSHLVMFPAGGNGTSTVHLAAEENPFNRSSKVVFTPTVLKSEDSSLRIELLDSQEDLLHEINLDVKESTCGTPEDGVQANPPYLKSLKKRVNSIRPVLNSLFIAGSE